MTRADLTKAGAGFGLLLAVLMLFEGFSTKSYRDVAGVQTICVGHTGPEVRPGLVLSREICKQLLAKDAEWAWLAVDKNVTSAMTPWQWVALASWTFNFGEGALKKSTLLGLANRGNWIGACRELPKWNKALAGPGGPKVVVRGLVNRRTQELFICRGYIFDQEFSPNHRPGGGR